MSDEFYFNGQMYSDQHPEFNPPPDNDGHIKISQGFSIPCLTFNNNVTIESPMTPLALANDDDEVSEEEYEESDDLSGRDSLMLLLSQRRDHYNDYPSPSLITYVAMEGPEKALQYLLNMKCQPNDLNGTDILAGNTALHYSITTERINVITTLIDNKADVNARNCHGETSLHFAMRNRSMDVLELLLKRRANPNIQLYNGITPLHIACTTPINVQCVQLLLDKRANLDICDDSLTTAEKQLLGQPDSLEKMQALSILQRYK